MLRTLLRSHSLARGLEAVWGDTSSQDLFIDKLLVSEMMVVQKGLLGGQLAEERHLSLGNGSIAIIGLRGVMLFKLIMRMFV